MAQANAAIETILSAHLPYPALVIDRGWDLVAANDAIYGLLEGVDPALLEPPVNVIRLALHPDGLAPRTVNAEEWREQLVRRLRHELEASADPRLEELLAEFGGTTTAGGASYGPGAAPDLVVPLQVRVGDAIWSFLSTTTVFGTPREVTLSELAIEAFYPADDATRAALTAEGFVAG